MKVLVAHRTRFVRGILATMAVLALSIDLVSAADATNKPSKISGMIRYHQKLKERPPGVSVAEHKKNLQARGLKADKLDREEVSLYVTRPLTAEEVRAFKTRGIEIQTNNWVPPRAYTIGTPAVADGAIAVAAYTHRTNYVACNGSTGNFGETLGQIASFSSRGPRVDGLQKPDVAAPGSITISTISLNNNALVSPDNAGLQLPNIGVPGCTYAAYQGTSMACPHAAGIAALILSANPSLSPADVRTLMTTGGSRAATRDSIAGYGLLDARESVYFAEFNLPGVWVSFPYVGTEEGNCDRPFNTLAEGLNAAPSAPPAIIPRVRIKAGNRPGAVFIDKAVRLESYGGTSRLGP